MNNASTEELTNRAARIRGHVVRMSHLARAAHLGSALSCVDLLTAIYWRLANVDPRNPQDPNRDRVILSKGHASSALYATLAERGFFDCELLSSYGQDGTSLSEQMSPGCVPGVEAATGSLGHGLSLGAGMALAAKIQDRVYRVHVVVSDGECNEGSIWEAAMFAAARRLDNLTVLIDYNRWQATGRSDDVLEIAPLREKWRAFGFATCEVDGHDFAALLAAGEPTEDARPQAIIANTIKGKGVSFMEDDNNWHYRSPNEEELRAALLELGQAP